MWPSLKKLNRYVAAAMLLLASPATAQDEAALLQRLQAADQAEAQQIEAELVLLWSRSGSASMDLLLARGRRALAQGDTEGAIEQFTALTDHAPEFAEGWNARAIAYFQAGLYGPSIADIGHVLALNPHHFGAMAGLAAMLEDTGQYQKALEVQRRIAAIYPAMKGLQDAIGRLEKQTGGATL